MTSGSLLLLLILIYLPKQTNLGCWHLSHLSQNIWSSVNNLKTHVILDFTCISKLRQMQLSNYSAIGGVTRQVIVSAKHDCENELLQVILDCYSDMSLKEGNRLRRINITPIDLLSMTETVPTPLQLDTFWASIQNKQGLGPQLVARELMKEYGNVLVILSLPPP